jgi:hypothetical protein
LPQEVSIKAVAAIIAIFNAVFITCKDTLFFAFTGYLIEINLIVSSAAPRSRSLPSPAATPASPSRTRSFRAVFSVEAPFNLVSFENCYSLVSGSYKG